MSLSPLGEPPAGTNLNAYHGSLNYAPAIATYSLAVIAVGLRFYTRFRMQTVKIGADDWVIVAALVCCHRIKKKKKKKGSNLPTMTYISNKYIQLPVTACLALVVQGMYIPLNGVKGPQF